MQHMDSRNIHNLPFMKMHGLGNDFVVIDAREREIQLSQKVISSIADRHFGVGFDQLAVISKGNFDAHLSFYNSEGKSIELCLELFNWEKLDFVDKIKKLFKLV